MDDKKREDQDVFTQPIRKMTQHELDQVAGGDSTRNMLGSGTKGGGWPDNQSKNQTG